MENIKFMEKDEACLLGQELFWQYSTTDKQSLQQEDARRILKEIYGSLQTPYEEDSDDEDKFIDVCDVDGDGFATQSDFELLAIKYLSGEGIETGDKYLLTHLNENKQVDTLEDKLKIAREFFTRFDVDKNGIITKEEVGPLLKETYKSMGINYNPTDREIRSWLKMADINQDGKVDIDDYEKLIKSSLLKSGIYAEK